MHIEFLLYIVVKVMCPAAGSWENQLLFLFYSTPNLARTLGLGANLQQNIWYSPPWFILIMIIRCWNSEGDALDPAGQTQVGVVQVLHWLPPCHAWFLHGYTPATGGSSSGTWHQTQALENMLVIARFDKTQLRLLSIEQAYCIVAVRLQHEHLDIWSLLC